MTEIKQLQITATIAAPADKVWRTMLDDASYRKWTAPFFEGSYFEGDWSEGSRMLFLAPNGDGMIAEIAEARPGEHLCIRHIGMIVKGVEDTESDEVKAWAPAYEKYTLEAVDGGTRVIIDQECGVDGAESMQASWTAALKVLGDLCEGYG